MDDARTIFIGQGGARQRGKSVQHSLISRVGMAPIRGLFRGR
jgi:hypothetical protein